MLTLEPTRGSTEVSNTDAALRWRFPTLAESLVLPWSELPMLGLDEDTPWLYVPVERDPFAAEDGRTAVPARERRRLRAMAGQGVPFQRIAIAHELDASGPVRSVLPELRTGMRTCTDAVARAVVGPTPPHPFVRRTADALEAVLGRGTAGTLAALRNALDPIVFGVVGLPEITDGQAALFYPLSAWRC